MNSNLKELYTAFDVLKFPLTVWVVFIHIIHEPITPIIINLDANNLYHLLYSIISQNLGRIVVPCFYLISGFFFFNKCINTFDFTGYKLQLQKRFKSLIIPYLLWNLIFAVSIFAKNYFFGFFSLDKDALYSKIIPFSLYSIVWEEPLNYPLWYIRDLIIVSFLSPLIYLIIKHTKAIGIFVLSILYVCNFEIQIPGFSSVAIFFFSLGAFLNTNTEYFILLIKKFRKELYIFSLALLFVVTHFNGTEYYEYFIRLLTIVGVFSLINLGFLLIKNKNLLTKLSVVSETSLFIYLIHAVYIINWIKGAISKLTPLADGYGQILQYFLTGTTVIVTCMFIYWLLKKIMPKVLTILCGGR